MAISPATAAAALRLMSHSKTSLQTLIRRHLIPSSVQLMNGSAGSLRTFPSPNSIEDHRTTGLVTPVVQFRSGLAAERFVSQARVEARGRPVKIDDDVSDDGDSDDDSGCSDDVDYYSDGDKYLTGRDPYYSDTDKYFSERDSA